jgi:hypothetical protein
MKIITVLERRDGVTAVLSWSLHANKWPLSWPGYFALTEQRTDPMVQKAGTLHLLQLVTEKIQHSSCRKSNPVSIHFTQLPRSAAYDVDKVPRFVAYGIDKQT